MAKPKTKMKKLSRRQMVTLLGSGVVFMGTGGSAGAAAQAKRGSTKAAPSTCQTVVPFKGKAGIGANEHPILMADPCCVEGVSIFFGGFDKAGPPTKGHLTSFANVLTSSKDELLEYCVMVWGLKGTERTDLVKQMQEKYQMKEYTVK